MNHTTNYQLPKWEKTDRIQMKDFNDMTATLDAALKANADAMPKIVTGSYVGTGSYGASNPNTLTFDFAPKLVIICGYEYYAILFRGCSFGAGVRTDVSSEHSILEAIWSDSGISWYCKKVCTSNTIGTVSAKQQLNNIDITYQYIAIG